MHFTLLSLLAFLLLAQSTDGRSEPRAVEDGTGKPSMQPPFYGYMKNENFCNCPDIFAIGCRSDMLAPKAPARPVGTL